MAVLRALAPPFAIVLLVTAIIEIPIYALNASGSVAALGFIAIMIVAGILGSRTAEKWPE